MKLLLQITLLFIATSLSAQLECNYNEEVPVNFGFDSNDEPYTILQQDDGKIIVTGDSYFISDNHFSVAVARLNHNNTIDTTFGTNGRVGYTWDQRNSCISAALQSDGKILLGGYQAPGNGLSQFRPYVARLMSDGSIDSTFGIDGSAKLEIIENLKGSTVGIKQLESGKIQVAIIGDNPAGFGIIQLDEFGAYDSTFHEDGFAYHEQDDLYWQVQYGAGLFMEDGSVVIVGKSYDGSTHASLSKILPGGDRDSSFAVDGTLKLPEGILYNYSGIYGVLTEDEDVLVSAAKDGSPYKYILYKVDGISGDLVSDFGTDGKVESTTTATFGAVHSMATDHTNGDIYVAGTGSNSGYNATLWKVNEDGEEEGFCDDEAMQTYSFTYSQGIRAAYVTESGTLRIASKGGAQEENSDLNQGPNFVIHNNTIWVSVEEVEKVNFSIYPNPASSFFTIKTEGEQQIEAVRVFNQLGKQVLFEKSGSSTVNISELSSGIYIVELQSGESITRQKMIIK